ncbi:MAG: hypothetical protein WBX38_01110 [Candidatus Sulfotelmatobacter sp.]
MAKTLRQRDPGPKDPRHAVQVAETSGLFLIAFLLVLSTLFRYWHAIRWSLR